MSIQSTNSAETWTKVYQAFDTINFVSFDYESVKESLIQYMKLYYSEVFNDYIETSELIAIIDAFAVVAEQLAYRIDMATHENFITTAERKQNILKLAKLISYNSSRNLPARGLVKLTSISTTESVIDSQGNDLSNRNIVWNDGNNSLWKEQFFLVINRMMTKPFGQPSKSFTVGDVVFQLYSFANTKNSFAHGVHPYRVTTNTDTVPMEIVPSDLDADGVFEKTPDANSLMQFVYSNDGLGDGSDLTGFLMYTKQGTLSNLPMTFANPIPNQAVDINLQNINNTDVWINKVDTAGVTLERWEAVNTINAQNIYFNTSKARNKFEIETLENDRIRLLFGDGNFAAMPVGRFNVWVRQSQNSNVIIQKNRVVDVPISFSYNSRYDVSESSSLTFSLVGTLQNSAESEDIEHIRRKAPSTYYAQGRMVNGQDYNTLLLRDQSILKLKAVNRTFAGQPKYIDWNDASGAYQNIKVFGDDLRIYYELKQNSITSVISSRALIDSVIEPMLNSPSILNMMSFMNSQNPQLLDVVASQRYTFIESKKLGLQEKTDIQGKLDRHWYGEPIENVLIDGAAHALVSEDTDYLIYNDSIKRTIDRNTTFLNGIPSGLQTTSEQPVFGIGFTNDVPMVGDGVFVATATANSVNETWTIEIVNAGTPALAAVTGSITGYAGHWDTSTKFVHPSITLSLTTVAPFALGDAYVVDIANHIATKRKFTFAEVPSNGINLNGKWFTINGESVDATSDYNRNIATRSWVFLVTRNESDSGSVLDWEIKFRDLKIIVESATTKFWYNSDSYLVDADSKNRVSDRISLLKSNLDRSRTAAIGVNRVFDVVDAVKFDTGAINVNALEVLPTDSTGTSLSGDNLPDDAMAFLQFVNADTSNPAVTDYVYFKAPDIADPNYKAVPVASSTAIKNYFISGADTSDVPDASGTYYIRRIGRENLDFLWQHFSPNTNLIDPSTSNIIDMYVLTRGYFDNVSSYLAKTNSFPPVQPSPLELRNSYSNLLSTKMISDTVVMHSGKIKIVFGDLADPQLRAKFRVIKSMNATLTDEQIKAEVVSVINTYFTIDNWDFGDTFYATELFSLVHQRLPIDVASVVIVPLFTNNSFGSMFVIESAEDEIIQSSATAADVEIVSTFTAASLRQRMV